MQYSEVSTIQHSLTDHDVHHNNHIHIIKEVLNAFSKLSKVPLAEKVNEYKSGLLRILVSNLFPSEF